MAKGSTERRNHQRYAALPGSRVEFPQVRMFNLIPPRVVHTADMVDISRTGLSFRYGGRVMWSTDFRELIIRAGNEWVEKVRFKVISDRVEAPAATPSRRCGVQFTQLTSHAQSWIDRFVSSHAKTSTPSPGTPLEKRPENQIEGLSTYYLKIENP